MKAPVLCSGCDIAVAIAGGLCRRCYDRTPRRKAARRAWQQAQVWWRREGLPADPLDGWTGVAGIAVRSRAGLCVYRRPARHNPELIEVRRPGHPLAGSNGWVTEARAIAYDQWVEAERPRMACVWCRSPIVWQHRTRNRRPGAPTLARPVRLDPAGPWESPNVGVACHECAAVQTHGFRDG